MQLSKRLLIRVLLVVGFLIPLLLSFPVWFSNRVFPTVPLFINQIVFSALVDWSLLIVFGFSAIWFLLRDKGIGGMCFFLMYVLFCILDQTRIQNYFFEIALLIFFYSLFKNNLYHFKIAFFLLMAGTYIWSGLHKANETFYELWLGGLNKRIPFIPLFFRQIFTYAVPFLEALFGVSLLFHKTRKFGVFMIAIMHAIVLITLAISRSSFVVFPLNIINPLLLFILYQNWTWNVIDLTKKIDVKLKMIAIYTLIVPALNLIGYYDHLLAFSYFSGKPSYCNIVFLDKDVVAKVPEKIKPMVRVFNGTYYINVNEWSLVYTSLLCYPEERVYKRLKNYIELYTGAHSTALQYYKK